ncbi:MAG: hypothetical protein GYA53_05340, partial [Acidobacteria bacterium]|nr:hypothetical protein [Acidobacteriota bacterium]
LVFFALTFLLTAAGLRAEVLLDREPVQVPKALLFRDHADEHGYHYMPLAPKIATWPDGKPKFSFIQYVRTGKEITGGILHFLCTFGLTQTELKEAEQELTRIDKDGKIIGPVMFVSGQFYIISASAGEGGIFSRRVVGTGKAPLLAGSEAAVSIALTEEGSTLLMESFKKPTSDVSVQFLMTYQGLTPAYQALLTVDWDKVYNHKDFKAKVGNFLVSAQIQKIYDELREQGAIKLEVIGEDTKMDELLDTAYNTITKMMFEAKPVKPEEMGQAQASTSSSRLGNLFGIAHFGYFQKQVNLSGKYTVDLTRRKRDQREVPLTGNIGGVYQQYGQTSEFFSVVDLDDPNFEERTINVILDGEDLQTFQQYLNFAGITFKKEYENEEMKPITEDLIFDRTKFGQNGNKLSLKYRRKGDQTDKWLEYEYKPIWSYAGGLEVVGDWIKTNQPVITLTPPHKYRYIEVLAEEENMNRNGIIRIAVQFRHKNFGRQLQKEVVLRKGEPLNINYVYFHEPNNLEYEYNITWLFKDNTRVSSGWKKATDPFIYAYYEK